MRHSSSIAVLMLGLFAVGPFVPIVASEAVRPPSAGELLERFHTLGCLLPAARHRANDDCSARAKCTAGAGTVLACGGSPRESECGARLCGAWRRAWL